MIVDSQESPVLISTNPTCRLLLVEDSASDAALIKHALVGDFKGKTPTVTHVRTLEKALYLLDQETFHLILLDLNLPDSDGIETFLKLKAQCENIPIIILTSNGGEHDAQQTLKEGAQDYIFKHRLDEYWLGHAVKHALGRFYLIRSIKQTEAKFEGVACPTKNDFLANLSHEVRTPLSAISIANDLLAGEVNSEHGQQMIDIIGRNSRHLLKLVEDILEYSKVDAGKITVEYLPCSLDELIHEAISMLMPLAQAKGIKIVSKFLTPLPTEMDTDPTKLRQILTNLVGNAIKFTQTGSVTVMVHKEEGEGKKILRINVIDQGCGMTPAEQQRLFQPHIQGSVSTTRTHGGTGLGLVLARKFAKALGGDVFLAESNVGSGSTFAVTLPLVARGNENPDNLIPASLR